MEELEEFGLTKYESKAYLSLLSGMCDARTLASKSGVPFGRIYDVLASLESKGLVEKQMSRPKKFLAVEPKIALKRLLDLKNEETKSLMKSLFEKAGELEDELNRNFNKAHKESLFWNVAIGDDAVRKHMKRLEETERELFTHVELHSSMMEDREKRVWMNEFIGAISALLERGVKVKLLIGCNDIIALEELTPLLTPFLPFLGEEKMEIKITNTTSSPFDVMDGERVQLKVRNPARPQEYFASVYVWQREFAEELREKFQEMWEEAKEFRIRLE